MPTNNNHILNKLTIDIQVANQDQSFDLKHQLSSYWQEWIVDDMEKVLNQTENEDIVKIDKLEIDLGNIDFNNFENEIKQKFPSIFNAELRKKFLGNVPKAELEKVEFLDLDILVYFLETGQLPWWSVNNIILNELFVKIFKENPIGLKEILLKSIISENTRKRIIYQFDNHLLIQIFIDLFDLKFPIDFVENKLKIIKENNSNLIINNRLKQRLLLEAIFINIRFEKLPDFQIESIINSKIVTIIENEFNYKLENISEGNLNEILEIEKSVDDENVVDNEVVSEGNLQRKINTQHAGLVILAAFLPKFFQNLGFIEYSDFVSDKAKHKAIFLLNYLATGNKVAAEHELFFEKLLVGLALYEPIPKEIELTDLEIFEAQDLLKSVLQHWKPLEKTSIDGLRSSFLLREGILYDEADHWKLRVERKSFDMLLDQIPWSFAFLNFNWTPKPIEIEW